MARLEDLRPGASVRGILPNETVAVVTCQWHGQDVLTLVFRDASGRVRDQLVYRDQEPTIEIAAAGRPWTFDADGGRLRMVAEAYRIRLAYLFDPLLAVHTSLVDPLPHQITAVYEEMLTRQPLRYVLADDPGSGKTIMAGLLIRELLARGDLDRCLIVCPGNLVEQWQDELERRFHLPFEIMTNDKFESARTGNWFEENPLAVCRLDKLSRNADVQAKLERIDWDLVVCDEAHKMSATFFGGEINYTKRYRLGQLLSRTSRHFLLMTATPHNGKEEDFQLFMALLDGDRFEGKFRDGVHVCDTSDMMRRLVKEQLLKFDGTRLFPERRAYTVNYQLSPQEADLYKQVTDYVRQEFNRADALENDGRKGTVGFALTILQRRLASSPEAIFQSLRRRRERLEKRIREEHLLKRGAEARLVVEKDLPSLDDDDADEIDDAPGDEQEKLTERIVDQATAARTIAELQIEIEMLASLEKLALQVRRSGTDRKWEELSALLLNNGEMFDAHGHRRKLVIFTEHRDTLNYLLDRIRTLLGRPDAIVAIHGGLLREERRKAQEAFTQDKTVEILVATDAAGEGINLQRSHLMVNYDLPWNPNRLEQRFGRIHRIGQTEVCHLWNIVAAETREGDVYKTLLEKLQTERDALGGAVFDVLGKVFEGDELRKLLIQAVRYGDKPEVRHRLHEIVDARLDREHLRRLIEDRALARDAMDSSRVRQVREELERADARRLQPHFISAFFIEAFQLLGGTIREREPKRFEITHVPGEVKSRDRVIGRGDAILPRYERITFEKSLINVDGKPPAAFVCPGHPLLDAVTDLVLERYRDLLKQGAILVSPDDPSGRPRMLLFLEHSIQDARTTRSGERRIVSRRMQFVELDDAGQAIAAGYAPYLDYRPLTDEERELVRPVLETGWLNRDIEGQAISFAATKLVPEHLSEVRNRKEELITKTVAAVKERLTKEITHWDHRAEELKAQEQAGKQPRMNWQKARERADSLQARLKGRLLELEQERQVAPLPPAVIGGALVIPGGLLNRLNGADDRQSDAVSRETKRIERLAVDAVIATERALGFIPRDVGSERLGYDIESSIPDKGLLRFIEVKGRVAEATTVTVTKNEILTALNKPEHFILAVVLVNGDSAAQPSYVRNPFTNEPDFGVTSVNFDLKKLLERGEPPR
jgi:superfamily II DNA or RNA helicase